MRGLDIIGAGEGLAAYTIMLRVRSIDSAKLRKAVDTPWGAALPGAIQMADSAPELALEVALPILKTELQNIGVMADVTKTQTPPKGQPVGREMLVVLGLGTALGFVLAVVGKSLYHLIKAR